MEKTMNGQQETQEIGRRELNRREKLLSIETAGRDLFGAKGFEETTTRELARTAGVGTGTLFLYFPEKRDLLLHLFHRDVIEVNARAFETVPRDVPLVDQLSHVFQRSYDYYERDLRLSRAFLRELFFADPEARRRHSGEERFEKNVEALVRAAAERGELRSDVEPRRAALLLMNLYVVGVVAWLVGSLPTRSALDELVRGNLELCLEGLSGRRRTQ
jgi:AcrR family transcriptional regulator